MLLLQVTGLKKVVYFLFPLKLLEFIWLFLEQQMPFIILGVMILLGCTGEGERDACLGAQCEDNMPSESLGEWLEEYPEINGDGIEDRMIEETAEDEIYEEVSPECPGGFGCSCEKNEDCLSNYCIITDPEKGIRKCTKQCIIECPDGWGCKNVGNVGGDPLFLCMPEVDPLCHLKCLKDLDCLMGNLCVKMESMQFCLRACQQDMDCPDGYRCEMISNFDNTTKAMQCMPKSGHCLCPPNIDYQNDPNHCGSCEHKCTIPHAIPACEWGECTISKCEDGYVNLNGNKEDGCEYQCSKVSDTDEPDPLYQDLNCDGIDGEVSKAIFVDQELGDDQDNDLGDQKHPFKTIMAAVSFASKQSPKKDVYVSKGQYNEQVILKDGVSLFGGYDANNGWTRNIETNKTIIMWGVDEGFATRTVVATNITTKTVFDGFYVKTANATQPSSTSYGMYVYLCSAGLVISNNIIEAGNGASGKNGLSGMNGANGNDGGNGTGSFEYDGAWCSIGCNKSSLENNKGGAGGASVCGKTGGAGGKGGKSEESGLPGQDGAYGGGKGGYGGGKTNNGGDGQKGKDGKNGKDGKGGSALGFIAPSGLWVAGHGENGEDGEDGLGGGGGGGGGGDHNSFPCSCYTCGAGGGGGGGGGCAGKGGTGGTGGGSSFALFILQSNPIVFSNTLIAQNGGNGGNGGAKGLGGIGGNGGKGGGKTDDNAGAGGNGGAGGKGGDGGGGGGGAGGSSFGIFIADDKSNPTCKNNNVSLNGFSGAGGQGGGINNNGENGKSGPINKPTSNCPAP